jgi:ADP-ribose pyrophosphatase
MSKIVAENNLFKVEESEVIIKNKTYKTHKIIENDIVVILPIVREGYILLEEQYRYGINKILYELPAGHVEKGENLTNAAKRELEEETGFKADKMTFMTFFYGTPGIISKRESLFVAEGLQEGTVHLDFDEEIKVREISIDDCIKMIESNEIIDAKTIIALLYYKVVTEKRRSNVS